MGTELFHEDRQMDKMTNRHDEANSQFQQLCEGAQKGKPQSVFKMWKFV